MKIVSLIAVAVVIGCVCLALVPFSTMEISIHVCSPPPAYPRLVFGGDKRALEKITRNREMKARLPLSNDGAVDANAAEAKMGYSVYVVSAKKSLFRRMWDFGHERGHMETAVITVDLIVFGDNPHRIGVLDKTDNKIKLVQRYDGMLNGDPNEIWKYCEQSVFEELP